jgi:hypothetical protein
MVSSKRLKMVWTCETKGKRLSKIVIELTPKKENQWKRIKALGRTK